MSFLLRKFARLVVRIGSRHYLFRRFVWLYGIYRWFRRRGVNTTQVITLRPGETMNINIDAEARS